MCVCVSVCVMSPDEDEVMVSSPLSNDDSGVDYLAIQPINSTPPTDRD